MIDLETTTDAATSPGLLADGDSGGYKPPLPNYPYGYGYAYQALRGALSLMRRGLYDQAIDSLSRDVEFMERMNSGWDPEEERWRLGHARKETHHDRLLHRIGDVAVVGCGDGLRGGGGAAVHRIQHGDNPEMVSPVFTGEERSFGWRDSVDRDAYDDDRDDYAREQAIEDGRFEYER